MASRNVSRRLDDLRCAFASSTFFSRAVEEAMFRCEFNRVRQPRIPVLLLWAEASTHKFMLQSVRSKIRIPRALHFLENARAIGADRLDRQMYLVRDLRRRLAARKLHENLKLAVR